MDEPALSQKLAECHVVDWQTDPFSRGAYMYVPVGEYDTPGRLAAPVDETLFFAGEATEQRLAGTVGGAWASASSATRQLLTAQPASLKGFEVPARGAASLR